MKVFLDTSVVIAAFWGDQTGHDASLKLFAGTTSETGACSIHFLAEVYATMMALPVRPILAPEQVFLFVQQITERLTTITLDQSEYLEVARRCRTAACAGGNIYDALLPGLRGDIYIWNVKHLANSPPTSLGAYGLPDLRLRGIF